MLNLIAQTVQRVEAKVDSGFESIRRDYVPRIELDPRLKAMCDRLDDLEDARTGDARERRNVRLAVAGVAIAGASATTGVVALLLPHLS